MTQRIGDRQQQAVSSGQRGSQTTGSHQARHHVRQAANGGRGQHNDVTADGHLVELQNAVLVDVHH